LPGRFTLITIVETVVALTTASLVFAAVAFRPQYAWELFLAGIGIGVTWRGWWLVRRIPANLLYVSCAFLAWDIVPLPHAVNWRPAVFSLLPWGVALLLSRYRLQGGIWSYILGFRSRSDVSKF
jgi:hypothetical protein